MALKGKAKTDYQRDYMRRRRALLDPTPELVRPIDKPIPGSLFIPGGIATDSKGDVVKPKTDVLQSTTSPVEEVINTVVPLYNPKVHKPGDLVRKYIGGRYQEVEVKEVDAEGNVVPEYY